MTEWKSNSNPSWAESQGHGHFIQVDCSFITVLRRANANILSEGNEIFVLER